MKPILIRQHGPAGPPSILGEWLRDRSIPAVVYPTYVGFPSPSPEHFAAVATLGSAHSPADDEPAVIEELTFLRQALDRDVPVLGLCYGGQALAVALGGTVEPADPPELGWHQVETSDPTQIPAGPWLQWHYHRFTVPDGAEELATSAAGSQAFRFGRSLGVQFHPESRVEQVRAWARKDAAKLARHGVQNGEELLRADADLQVAAQEAAYRLFDGFWSRAHEDEGTPTGDT